MTKAAKPGTPKADSGEVHRLHELSLAAGTEPLFARLAEAIPGLGRRPARQAILAGLVTVSGAILREPNAVLEAKAKVRVDLRSGVKAVQKAQRQGAAGVVRQPFTVLHEDPQLIVIDKAAGILSAPTRGDEERDHVVKHLRAFVRKQGRAGFVGLVHRLDAETSGCLCFALTRDAQGLLTAQFAGGAATRTYRCLVHGAPKGREGTCRSRIGRGVGGLRASVEHSDGKESVTHWKVLRRFAKGSELEVRLETGRTHQIRIHLDELGCPVLGDPVYGRGLLRHAIKAPRLMLHAVELSLDHPRDGKRLPKEWAEVEKALG